MAHIAKDTCIIRNTAAAKGRTWSIVPGKTASTYLHYGRIILDRADPPLAFQTNDMETGLVCLKGSATVRAGGESLAMSQYDSVYVPRDAAVEVVTGPDGCDFAEIAAPVSRAYPVQYVPYAGVQKDAGLHMTVGAAPNQRDVMILIGKNVEAGRILAGVTFSKPGNWTSWPPHEHAAMLEEAYLYIDMPAPSYGVQLVYTDKNDPELATIVRQDDVVLMPEGYHPNVAAPGGSINFLWMMAAHRERDDRRYGVVNVHPDFAAVPSGIEKLGANR
jgi:5-deoxy-glucuronate isomerase